VRLAARSQMTARGPAGVPRWLGVGYLQGCRRYAGTKCYLRHGCRQTTGVATYSFGYEGLLLPSYIAAIR
jgi:hypothetical protein